MFAAAQIRLTAWYLLIIMAISILFSVVVYQTARHELTAWPVLIGRDIEGVLAESPPPETQVYTTRMQRRLLANLIYINCVVLVVGGLASFVMARRTLRPIQAAHESMARFTSDASHELRTPLAVMKTEIEVALSDPRLTKADMRELLTSNLEEVNRLSQLAGTLLKLSRHDYGGLTHDRIALDKVIRTVAARADRGQGRLELHLPKRPVLIDAHRPSIDELLTILIDNAHKYSPPDSPITITTTLRQGRCITTITNQGDGIAPQDLPHIFDRFYQADNARTQRDGHGLGLSLAHTIVAMHRGTITATSGIGHDTSFSIVLPLATHAKRRQAPVDKA